MWETEEERNKTVPPKVQYYLLRSMVPKGGKYFFLHRTHYRNLSEDSFTYINIMQLCIRRCILDCRNQYTKTLIILPVLQYKLVH